MAQFTNNIVINNYNQIINELNFVSKLLRKRLEYCNVPDLENKSFDDLINKIEDIQSVTHINKYNEKPLVKPELNFTNISKFNESLYKLIRFYMRKIAYYLVLKGIPTYIVKKAQTLRQLIDLILFIEVISGTTLSVEGPNVAFYGTSVNLLVNLVDDYNFVVLKGNIIVRDKETGAVLSTTKAGQDVYFSPPDASRKINDVYQPKTFIVEYQGTEKYLPAEPVEIDIIVYPGKINLQVDIKNISQESRYYNSTTTGYNTDTWNIKIATTNYNNTPLQNIPFTMKIGNETINGSTDASGNYQLNKVINQTGNQLINIKSTYANTNQLTNSEYEHTVKIKYNVLQQENNTYTDYAGKSYTLEATLHNEIDNSVDNQYDNNDVDILIDGVEVKTIHAQNGVLTLDIDELSRGQHVIVWVFNGDDFHTSMKTTVNIISNFIYNETDLYYLNDLPEIQYKPLGQTTINKRVQGTLKHIYGDNQTVTNVTFNTNKNGILHALSNYSDIGTYELTLTTDSDNLSETRIFNYEIKKPFIIDLESYNRKDSVVYTITTFRLENNHDTTTSIIAKNKNNVNITPTFNTSMEASEDGVKEKYKRQVKYSANINTYGSNTLTVSNNGYTESINFNFVSTIFTLLTNSVQYGYSSMKIQSNIEVDSIQINSNDIEDIIINKENNIFTISGFFKRVGNVTFNVIDDVNSSEELTINVQKADVDANAGIILEKDDNYNNKYSADAIPYDNRGNNVVFLNITSMMEDEISINYLINDALNNSFNYQGPHTKTLSDLIPGQYTAKFIFNGNEHYNSFIKTVSFKILKKNPNINIDEISNNMAIYRDDIDYEHPVYNNFVVSNTDNVDFDLYIDNSKKNITYNNNIVKFLLTETGSRNLKIVTKETSIFNSVTIQHTIYGYDFPKEINNIITKQINNSEYSDDYIITDKINCIIINMLSNTDGCDNDIKQRINNIIDRMREI